MARHTPLTFLAGRAGVTHLTHLTHGHAVLARAGSIVGELVELVPLVLGADDSGGQHD